MHVAVKVEAHESVGLRIDPAVGPQTQPTARELAQSFVERAVSLSQVVIHVYCGR